MKRPGDVGQRRAERRGADSVRNRSLCRARDTLARSADSFGMPTAEYTIRAAARALHINRKTLAAWVADGRVRARRTVTGRVYISRAELVRLDPSLATVEVPRVRDATASALSRLFGTPMAPPTRERGPR